MACIWVVACQQRCNCQLNVQLTHACAVPSRLSGNALAVEGKICWIVKIRYDGSLLVMICIGFSITDLGAPLAQVGLGAVIPCLQEVLYSSASGLATLVHCWPFACRVSVNVLR